MTTYVVTTSNWNDPFFWSSISESGPGHTLDFSALSSNFSINFDADGNTTALSDGTTTFTIGEPGTGGTDANLGGTSDWSFFNTVFGSQGDDTQFGGTGLDVLSSERGDDSLFGGGDNDTLNAGTGNDYLEGGDGNDELVGDGIGVNLADLNTGPTGACGWQ